MSTTCIELSSDDDADTPNGSSSILNSPDKRQKDAVQKLSRNSSIELTINLENVSDEAVGMNTKRSSPSKNGCVLKKAKTSSDKESQRKEKENKPERSESPDVVVIDDDVFTSPPKPKPIGVTIAAVGSLNPYFGPQHLAKTSSNTPVSNKPRRSSTSTRPLVTRVPAPLKSPPGPHSPPSPLRKSTTPSLQNRSRQIFSTNVSNTSKPTNNTPRQRTSQPIKRITPSSANNDKTPLPLKEGNTPNDIVYIIDDEDEDEVVAKDPPPKKRSTTDNSLMSYTEQLVNSLREKIELKCKKSNPVKSGTGPTPPARRRKVHSDRAVSSQIVAIPGSSSGKSRVTRSLTSSPPKKAPGRTRSSTDKASASSSLNQQQPINNYSIENMFRGLVGVCNKHFPDDNLETRMWSLYKKAADGVLKSEAFISSLKTALSSAEKSSLETLDEKLIVQRDVKEVLRMLKRTPLIVDSKVKTLSKTLSVIRARIKKLEETEVDSDDDKTENSYVLLDRYRARAVKIYEKICELQNESPNAGRLIRQSFSFSGSSGYPKIEKALHKFYLKTNCFPDFVDVKSVVEMTSKKENLNIPPHKIQTIAQSIFIEFGNRLQRMRCFDEYSIMNEYLEEGSAKDPALMDPELSEALERYDSTKKIRESEQKIFEEYTSKQLEMRETGDKDSAGSGSDDDKNSVNSDDGSSRRKPSKRDLHFSDTDEELINSDVKATKHRKHSSSEDEYKKHKKKKSRSRSDSTSSNSDDSSRT